jgi:hypothetical protein
LFPTDDEEFLILYAVYIGLFLILLAGTLFSRHKKSFRNNLIFFSVYAGIMLLIFSNENNFKYGSSLTVLFYGGVFILLHLMIFIFRRLFILLSKQQQKK